MAAFEHRVFWLAAVCCMAGFPSINAHEGLSTDAAIIAVQNIQDGFDLIVPDVKKTDAFRLRVGVGFGSIPDYIGSSSYRRKVMPLIDIRYGKRWRLSNRQLRYAAFLSGEWKIGPFIKQKSGRREARSPALAGLGNIKNTAQIGLFAKYRSDTMLFNAEFRHALGARQGGSVRVTVGHGLFKSGDFAAAIAISSKWLSKTAMQTNFGISHEQSLNSDALYREFEPASGISDGSISLFTRYKIGRRTRLVGLASYGRLLGAAADSPLVVADTGSADQFKVGIGFTFDF